MMKILLVTNTLPYPPISGHPIRNYNLLRQSSKQNETWVLSLVPNEDEAENVLQLKKICKEVIVFPWRDFGAFEQPASYLPYLFSGTPPDLRLNYCQDMANKIFQLTSENDFDVLQIEDSFMAKYVEALPPGKSIRKILTFHDIGFRKYDRIFRLERKNGRKIRLWLHATMMRHWEPKYAERFDCCITMSELDRDFLLAINPKLNIAVVPNGIDATSFQPLPNEPDSCDLIFVGNMNYRPNIDAMIFFSKEVFPMIREEFPVSQLWIVGINPGDEVKQLEGNGIIVTGRVEDVMPYYQKCSVCVVPLRAGGGTRLKILESMALGRPVVSTSVGCEGLNVQDGDDIFIADDPNQFASRVISLIKDNSLREKMAKRGRQLVETQYDWKIIAQHYHQALSGQAG